MKRKRTHRTTQIEVETRDVVVSGGGSAPIVVWCPTCGRQAPMQSPEMAARLVSVDLRTIYRWIEAGEIHCSEKSGNALLVCLVSLIRLVAPAQSQPLRTEHE